MELALYDESDGYYMTTGSPQNSLPNLDDSRIGWSGDFYTSPDVHPLLAKCLVKQIHEIDDLLGRPSPFTVVEMGPGKGLLARDMLQACVSEDSDLSSRLTYVLIERSPIMQDIQARNLREYLEKGLSIQWRSALSELEQDSVLGFMFSNELVDAFPVHRVRKVAGNGLKEIFVASDDGQLCERLDSPSSSEIADYVDTYVGSSHQVWPDDYCTELHIESVAWMKDVARVLQRGFVLTIDYGHTASDYYDASRTDGTLLCYYKHSVSSDPLTRVGEQDITAHVNFSALAIQGRQAGLTVSGFTNLMNFLLGLGADEMLADVDPESEEMQSAIQFLRPQSMGQTFKFLVQHKAVESPTLQGLRYRPFFNDALFSVNG